MRLQEIGAAIRKARQANGLTQADLAAAAGLSRTTLNRLENGLFPDLGVKKADAILEQLGMQLAVRPATRTTQPDFIAMACASVSVSFRNTLTPDELVHALLSGRPAPGKEAHFVALLEEAPPALLRGLIAQVGKWGKPGKVETNVRKIARALDVSLKSERWRKIV